MKQVILIGGGTTFYKYEDYIEYLSNKPLDIKRFIYSPNWKSSLQEKLGKKYQVLMPSMPNTTNAKYSEWSIWFNHISEIFTDEVILIGHSLGASFLTKYLSENELKVKIDKLILIAAPYDDETIEDLTDFKITEISEKLKSQSKKITIFHGSDDPVVPILDQEKYKQALPNATFITLSAPEHFAAREEFPEIIDIIKA